MLSFFIGGIIGFGMGVWVTWILAMHWRNKAEQAEIMSRRPHPLGHPARWVAVRDLMSARPGR
jgi:hypothetical protein